MGILEDKIREFLSISSFNDASIGSGYCYNHGYGYGDMYFEPEPPTKEVLDKYGITEEEYYNICNELEYKLGIGCCGWCV